MAINDPWNVPIDINSYDYAIKGNMITSRITMSDLDFLKIDPQTFQSDIKQQLMVRLLNEIMNIKCVEFTKSEDHHLSFGQTHFRARMFVVPDDQVRILRVSQLNNTIP
jgi:hypothetical protein